MTANSACCATHLKSGVVDPDVFVNLLIGRDRLERDDDFEHGEFGLRDPATGERIRVQVQALTKYAAQRLDLMHSTHLA
jgi:hypothetical protein